MRATRTTAVLLALSLGTVAAACGDDEESTPATEAPGTTAEAPGTLGKRNTYGGDDKKNKIGWFGPVRDNGWWNPAFVPGPAD